MVQLPNSEQELLEEWNVNVIIPLPKKGDLSLMTSYRGISLTSIAAKVYIKILLNRIRPHIDPIQYNTLLILPEGLFRINLQYEYKIMTKTTDINYNDINFLDIKITT